MRLVIVSRIYEIIVSVWRSRLAALLLAVTLSGAIAGCCGGAHSHKCDFSPLDSPKDGGKDGPMMCGTLICQPPTVCCAQKIAPYFSCVPLEDFATDNCELPPSMAPACLGSTDCDGGAVCCLQTQAAPPVPPLSCQPPGICQGPNTYVTCTTDLDCPNQVPGSCTFVAGGADAGYTLSVCPPQ
jgi:hypothetical protein